MRNLWRVVTFGVTAFNVGYCVYKLNPLSVGIAVFCGLYSVDLIFGKSDDDRESSG